jgi:hypothetical protein
MNITFYPFSCIYQVFILSNVRSSQPFPDIEVQTIKEFINFMLLRINHMGSKPRQLSKLGLILNHTQTALLKIHKQLNLFCYEGLSEIMLIETLHKFVPSDGGLNLSTTPPSRSLFSNFHQNSVGPSSI